MKFILILMMSPGCVDQTYREFNREDKQDPSCYGTYGARRGYCDALGRERTK